MIRAASIARAFCALAVIALFACSRGADPNAGAPAPVVASSANVTNVEGAATRNQTVMDFTTTDGCAFGHRGVLLDLGDASMTSRMAGTSFITPDVEVKEREGATWASVHDRALELSFVTSTEVRSDAGVIVEARMRGGVAKSVVVSLNGRSIGALSLTKGEAKTVGVRSPNASIVRGTNELSLRFSGSARAPADYLAEIDWVRVGPYDGDAPYAAPTRADAVATVTIGGIAKRGVSLRAPGFARCTGYLPSGAFLEGDVGVTGGDAEAEVRVVTDRAEPRVVGTFHLGAAIGSTPSWRPLSLPLGDIGTLASIELVAKSSAKGARVVFGEPRIVVKSAAEPPKMPASKGVVLVVLGTIAPRALSLYGGKAETREIAQLASGGIVFEAHRAPTTLANAALASMLTGLSPRAHGMEDLDAALRPDVVTIAQAARQAGVATAMFTANPTTSDAFGFGRAWETFRARLPADDAVATAVFDDAGEWLDKHKDDRFLLVIHARGGHPPWDVSDEDLKQLPPVGYSGALEPKHGGEALARARRAGSARLFGDADRQRAIALHEKTIALHDEAVGRLAAHLKAIGRSADTTWIVTSDVGVDPAAHVPFLEDDAIDDGALAVPLVVRTASAPARSRSSVPTSGVDVARTVLEALGLPPPPEFKGESLWTLAARPGAAGRPTMAMTKERLSARWGEFVLVGAHDREAKLCNLSLEADCVSDVRPTYPVAAEAMHDLVYRALARKAQSKKSLPTGARASIDPDTATALKAWGR